MQATNPFPGMNPFLELGWPDVHTRLIAYVSDALSDCLPADLRVVAEESAMIGGVASGDPRFSLRADVAVVKSDAPTYVTGTSTGSPAPAAETIVAAVPETIRVERTVRWIEIRNTNHRLVTVIEILSPSNKSVTGSAQLALRQDQLILSGVNTVDIDLLRGGFHALPEELNRALKPLDETTYLIVTGRANQNSQRDVYYCGLRERLPVISIPLRKTDQDVPLDLQPLIDRCYQTGRYWHVTREPLPPPPFSPTEQAWIDAKLQPHERHQ